MSFWSRIADFARRKAETGAVGSELVGAWDNWGMSGAGIAVNSVTALRYVAVMSCVSVLAEDVAKLPIHVMRRLPNGGKVQVRPGEPGLKRNIDALAQLLRRPNPWQTRFEFMEMMMAALALRSDNYAPVVRDRDGYPRMLVPVHPDRVSLFEAPGGEYFWAVARQGLHEVAVLEDLPFLIHSDDMLHVRWLQTWHSLLGTSRVMLMKEAIGVGAAQEQMAARLAGNGARPSGILTTDKTLSEPAATRLRDRFKTAHGGWRNAGQVAVLEEGLKWQPLGMTMVDAEFMASREFQLEDVARGFRIPHFKVGLTIERGDLVQLQQMYLNDVISTWCERWVPKFEELGELDGDEYFVEFDYSHFLKADIQTRLTAMRLGVVGMIYTPNEARRGEGLPDVEGGDTLYQPVNVAPIGFTPQSAAGGPGSDLSGAPAEGGRGDPATPPDTEVPNDNPGDPPSPTV